MRRAGLIALALFVSFVALANPIPVGPPSSLATFHSPVFWGLLIESIAVGVLMAFFGFAPVPMFLCYFLTNVIVFTVFFLPLLEKADSGLGILALELCVVLLDGTILLLLSRVRVFRGPRYRLFNWWRAGLVSTVGNLVSFLVGWVGYGSLL